MDSHDDVAKTPSATPRSRSENADINMATAVISSPALPNRPNYHLQSPSISRKRTNEQVYQPIEQPKPSPTASRFQIPTNTAPNVESQHKPFETERDHDNEHSRPQTLSTQADSSNQRDAAPQPTTTDPLCTSKEGFVQGIQAYQQGLELDFQDFEHSLTERDKSAELTSIEWDELETRYNNEIQPKIDAEQEIMTEFNARFQVCSKVHGFQRPLTSWLSNSCCTCKYQTNTSPKELSKD